MTRETTTRNNGQVVYLIEHEHGFIKIGRSNNPRTRVADLQTACPYDLGVIGVIDTADATETERRIHERYADQQVRGEWYNLRHEQKQRLLAQCDLDSRQIDWRYHRSESQRRKDTLTYQGLIG